MKKCPKCGNESDMPFHSCSGDQSKPFIQKLESMSSQEIRLLCGELTSSELRAVKAFKNWVVSQLKKG